MKNMLKFLCSMLLAFSFLTFSSSPASAETRLETYGAEVTWDETEMFVPQPSTVLSFNYANKSGITLRFFTFTITDPNGTPIFYDSTTGIRNGITGSWDQTLYYDEWPVGFLGPYTATLSITDYSGNVRKASTQFFLVPRPPGYTTMLPTSGLPGSKVEIKGGVGLNNITSVTLNGTSVAFTRSQIWGIYSVFFYIPSGSTSGSVVLTNPGGVADAGTFTVLSPPTPTLVKAKVTKMPSLSGTPKATKTLIASPGIWTGYPKPVMAYQWYSCNSSIATPKSAVPTNCKKITGATKSSFKIASAQKGKFVSVLVTGSSLGTTKTAWLSKSTSKVS